MVVRGRLLTAAGLFFCVGFCGGAQAAGLRVSPLRLDFSAAERSGAIQVFNLGPAPMAVQIKAYRWTQKNGEDTYEPTTDLFFAPPIVNIEGKKDTVIRFRLKGAVPADQEATYRVYFQEIPPANASTVPGMAFRLRFGVPVFVRPAKPSAPKLKIAGDFSGRSLQMTLENTGNEHIKVDGIGIFPPGVNRQQPDRQPLVMATQAVQGTNYLLPGTRLDWQLELPEGTDTKGLSIMVQTDDYQQRAAPGLDAHGWLWMPLKTNDEAPNGN